MMHLLGVKVEDGGINLLVGLSTPAGNVEEAVAPDGVQRAGIRSTSLVWWSTTLRRHPKWRCFCHKCSGHRN